MSIKTSRLDELRTALVGQEMERARVLALPYSLRVIKLDGKERSYTADVDESRLNVEVEGETVVKVAWVG